MAVRAQRTRAFAAHQPPPEGDGGDNYGCQRCDERPPLEQCADTEATHGQSFPDRSQPVGDVASARPARRRLVQARSDERVERRRHVLPARADRRRRFREDAADSSRHANGRRPASISYSIGAERENVRAIADRLSLHLLGRHVGDRADDDTKLASRARPSSCLRQDRHGASTFARPKSSTLAWPRRRSRYWPA